MTEYTTQALTDNKQAAVAVLNGQTRYFRVRKVNQASLPNSSGGQTFTDTVIQVQAYEVDADGNEVENGAGDVIGETRHGLASSTDAQEMIARLTYNAIMHHLSKLESQLLQEQIPDELLG